MHIDPLKFADVSIFQQKISIFCPKNYLYPKQQCESCVRDFLVLFSYFVRQKVTLTENIIFADSVSGIWPPDRSKLAKNLKNDNDVTIFGHDFNINFFDIVLFLLSVLVNWSKFHVNIITDSGIMTILFYKGLTGNTLYGFCPISGDWGELWIPNLA